MTRTMPRGAVGPLYFLELGGGAGLNPEKHFPGELGCECRDLLASDWGHALPDGALVDVTHAKTASGMGYSGPFIVRSVRIPTYTEGETGALFALVGDVFTARSVGDFVVLIFADTTIRFRESGFCLEHDN